MAPEPAESRREALPSELGARIRRAREEQGLTLRALAAQVGVSASLLSQLENDIARPSVGTLWAIVTELGVSLDSLFAADDGDADAEDGAHRPARVQRAGRRRALELDGGVRWERLTSGPDADADFAFVTYAVGGDSGADDPPTSHRGKEYGFVVSGRLGIEVGDQSLELGPGDAVVFGSETPHRFRALGDEPVQAVWLNLARLC
jgi:transcriptional regulator with XRE-family HTH domain